MKDYKDLTDDVKGKHTPASLSFQYGKNLPKIQVEEKQLLILIEILYGGFEVHPPTMLKLYRIARGDTINDVSRAVGIDCSSLSLIENKQKEPTDEQRAKLIKHYPIANPEKLFEFINAGCLETALKLADETSRTSQPAPRRPKKMKQPSLRSLPVTGP